MSYYTKFHMRVKLDFKLPHEIRHLLRNQCKSWQEEILDHHYGHWPLAPHISRTGQASTDEWPQRGLGFDLRMPNSNWDNPYGQIDHPFFRTERADRIPWSGNGEAFDPPVFQEYPDGSSKLIFTCEFNHAWKEIHEFLDWLKPYIRLKYGKRNRGRQKVWVGWWSSEDMNGRVDIFIKPCPTAEHPAMLFGREVEEDYRNSGRY